VIFQKSLSTKQTYPLFKAKIVYFELKEHALEYHGLAMSILVEQALVLSKDTDEILRRNPGLLSQPCMECFKQ